MSSTNLTALSTVGTDRMATESLIYGLNSAFIIISTICLALRLYTRTFIIRALGADDAMAVVAFVNNTFRLSFAAFRPRLLTRGIGLCRFSVVDGHVL